MGIVQITPGCGKVKVGEECDLFRFKDWCLFLEVTIARLDNASLLFEKIIARLDKLSFTLTIFY